MYVLLIALFTFIFLLITASAPVQAAPQEFQTDSGLLRLTLLGHGSVLIEWNQQVIYVDPYTKATSFAGRPKANQIWITHSHYDHLDMAAIGEIATPTTTFICDADSAKQLSGNATILRNGDQANLSGINITAVPAYNRIRERAPGLKFHPEGFGNGYVADFGGFRLYIAGDTEIIPEMSSLKEIDVALLPVMLPYTMSPDEAAQAAQLFQPKVVLPYHCTKQNAQQVAQLLANTTIEVRVVIP